MNKITSSFYLLVFGLIFSFSCHSQSIGPMVANPDSFFLGPLVGTTPIFNVLQNDTVGSAQAVPTNAIVTPVVNSPLAIDSVGRLTVLPGTPGGVYTITYVVCEFDPSTGLAIVPPNCNTNVATVVVPIVINAIDDVINMNGAVGGTSVSVLNNDTINGLSFIPSAVTLSSFSTPIPGISINVVTGVITVAPLTPVGTYTLDYFICETANPNNCDAAVVQINVVVDISLAMTGTYVDFNADGFTNVGDVITYALPVSNIGLTTLTNVSVNSPQFTVFGGPLTSLAAGVTDSSTFNGVYVLKQTDINAGTVTKSAAAQGLSGSSIQTALANTSNTLTISDGIKMKVFVDSNGNGIQDGAEVNFSKGEFHYELNNSGIINNLINPSGMVTLYESNPANLYNLTYTVDPAFSFQYVFSGVPYLNKIVPTASGITTYNFPITEIPFNDLTITLSPSRGPVPGFTYYNNIIYTNNGNLTVTSGTVTYNHDALVSITPVPGSVSIANGFTYAFTNLLPGETRNLWVEILVPIPPTAVLGNYVNNSALITLPVGDVHPLDNNSSLSQEIRGSYDPNDKVESHGDKILHASFSSSDVLTYTIRFENTGTGNAVNIKVDDVLDSKIDEASIKMIDASADYTLSRVGSNLSWKFSGIELPPSVPNTQIGKGYIIYTVKPKPGYAVGDIIPNTAFIYFDFNPAIITNTCTTEFTAPLANNQFELNNVSISPNPANNFFTINAKSTINKVTITDLNGRIVSNENFNSDAISLNINQLSNGIYLVKTETVNGLSVQKFIKE
jgi:Secretion system C-terminal sorting domain